MQGLNRRAMKHAHLFPRTSTKPIDLAEYLDRQERALVVDSERLNPEFVAWHERVRREGKHETVGEVKVYNKP